MEFRRRENITFRIESIRHEVIQVQVGGEQNNVELMKNYKIWSYEETKEFPRQKEQWQTQENAYGVLDEMEEKSIQENQYEERERKIIGG